MLSQILLGALLAVAQPGPISSPPSAPTEAKNGGGSNTEANNGDAPKTDDRYFLMKALGATRLGSDLEQRKISISGWTEMSFTGSSAAHEQLPFGFNYRANDFLLQQNWLRMERAVDTSASTATFGFRSDTIVPGSDYRFTLPRGIFNSQLTANNGNPNLYGIDPVQFYAEGYFPNIGKGLDVKIGRFFAQFGVEAIDAPNNALVSHAYTFIYNPFTHTGILGTLKLDDAWSVQSGLVLGSDDFISRVDTPTYLGSVKWAPPKGKDTVLFSVIVGSGRFNQAQNFHNPEIFDLVYTHKCSDKLTYTFEGLYGFTNNVPNTGFANWFGILNYLTYDFTSKLSGTTRLEFFDDAQGQRTGFEGLYTTLTGGFNYRPYRAVIFRPEIRYDFNADSRPFENRRGLVTAALDLIVRW